MRTTSGKAVLALLSMIATLGLAGCSVNSSGDSYAGDAAVLSEAEMSAEAPRQDIAPQIIRNANAYLEVESIDIAVADIRSATAQVDGTIDSESIARDDEWISANFTLRIPEGNLDTFLDGLEQIGEIQNLDVSAQDVTLEVVDLDARIRTLEDSMARLRELQQQATSVTDLVAVESELANRQSQLESLTARRDYLADQVSLSTVYLSLSERQVGPSLSPDFLGGLQRGWDALLTLGAGLITGLGFIAPTAIVIALLLTLILWIIRRIRKREKSL